MYYSLTKSDYVPLDKSVAINFFTCEIRSFRPLFLALGPYTPRIYLVWIGPGNLYS